MTAVPAGSVMKPAYMPSAVSVSAGDITFVLKNVPAALQESPPAHNLVLGPEAPELTTRDGRRDWFLGPVIASSRPVGPNKSEPLTVDGLMPGVYSFWCTIESHFTAGMVGTLTVLQ